jgi:hypothetical protein
MDHQPVAFLDARGLLVGNDDRKGGARAGFAAVPPQKRRRLEAEA